MGKLVGIFGPSGDGKTTATIVNSDGTYNPKEYAGMSPDSHFIVNMDKKELPFPGGQWAVAKKNYIEVDDFAGIKKIVEWISKQPQIKSVSFDTLNAYLAYKEFNDRRKMTFDQWRDVAIA